MKAWLRTWMKASRAWPCTTSSTPAASASASTACGQNLNFCLTVTSQTEEESKQGVEEKVVRKNWKNIVYKFLYVEQAPFRCTKSFQIKIYSTSVSWRINVCNSEYEQRTALSCH
jgi:hypothetical protein